LKKYFCKGRPLWPFGVVALWAGLTITLNACAQNKSEGEIKERKRQEYGGNSRKE
jgi:hypothetical protein